MVRVRAVDVAAVAVSRAPAVSRFGPQNKELVGREAQPLVFVLAVVVGTLAGQVEAVARPDILNLLIIAYLDLGLDPEGPDGVVEALVVLI